MSDGPRLLDELKRRKVVRVLLVYLAAAFATIEAADIVIPVMGLSDGAMRVVIGLVAVGLPIAVVLAWVFELTPQGVAKTPASAAGATTMRSTDRWFSARTVVGVAAMLVVGVVAGWLARSAAPGSPGPEGIRSIAVIPFDNLSTLEDNAFLAIGIQDEILTHLQKISELHVISRSSAMRYQPGPDRLPVPAMGEELGARWIVEGSVARVGQEVRLNVQLIESATDEHLWAAAYDGDLTVEGLLGFQAQIARRVAESLRATIQPQEEARIATVPTQSTDAWTLYLRGIDYFSRRREADLARALNVFDEAIAIDGEYALAYAGKALVYAVLPFYADVSVEETTSLGLAAAGRALALDGTIAEAHAATGDLLFHGRYDMDGAEAALRRAVELQPSYAQAHDWLSEVLLARGLSEHLTASRRALELDPLSLRANAAYGAHLSAEGMPDEAITQLRRTLAMDSTFTNAQEFLALAYLEGRYLEEAAVAFRRYTELVGAEAGVFELVVAALSDASARDAALAALDRIEVGTWRVTATAIARSYVLLDEHEKAIMWLERAYEAGDVQLPFTIVSRDFVQLRQGDRFRAIAARINLDVPN